MTSRAYPIPLYLGTDHVVEIPQLTNGLTGGIVIAAGVEVTLRDESSGTAVDGQTWPLICAEDSEVPGRYYGTLSAAVDITKSQRLEAVVVATAGAGLTRTWYIPVIARAGT